MLKPFRCKAPRREAALDEAERAEPHQHGGAQGGGRLVPGAAAVQLPADALDALARHLGREMEEAQRRKHNDK